MIAPRGCVLSLSVLDGSVPESGDDHLDVRPRTGRARPEASLASSAAATMGATTLRSWKGEAALVSVWTMTGRRMYQSFECLPGKHLRVTCYFEQRGWRQRMPGQCRFGAFTLAGYTPAVPACVARPQPCRPTRRLERGPLRHAWRAARIARSAVSSRRRGERGGRELLCSSRPVSPLVR